jgi:hypothetical protein
MNWGIQYTFTELRLVRDSSWVHRLAFCVTFGLLKGTSNSGAAVNFKPGPM